MVIWHWQHVYLIGGGKLKDPAIEPFYAVLFPFYQAGWLAVEFFFTLSGFVFFWLYGEAIAEQALGVGKFFIARFSRLYPLHFVTLLAIAIMQGLLLASGHNSFVYGGTTVTNFVLNLLFLQYFIHAWTFNGPEWSVGVEALLYGFFFVYCRLVRPNWLVPLVACVAFGMWVMYQDWGLGRGIVGFFSGGVVYEVWRQARSRPWIKNVIVPLLAATVLLWAVGVAEMRTHWIASSLNGLGLEGWRWLENFFRLVLVPMTVLALALQESNGAHFWKHMSPLGDLTYALYLWHFPLQLLMALGYTFLGIPAPLLQSSVAFLLYMGVLIAISILSYRYIERPAQDWLRNRLGRTQAPSAAQ